MRNPTLLLTAIPMVALFAMMSCGTTGSIPSPFEHGEGGVLESGAGDDASTSATGGMRRPDGTQEVKEPSQQSKLPLESPQHEQMNMSTHQAGGPSGGLTGADTCPGDPYSLIKGMPLRLAGSTLDQTGDYASYCGGSSSTSGPDVVYALTPTESGTLTITLLENTNGLNGIIYAQQDCGNPAIMSFLVCQDENSGVETFSFHAEQGTTYYVFVDGRDQTAGDFVLEASLKQNVCGDGVLDPATEQCDLGDVNSGDGCDSQCMFESPPDNSDACPGEISLVVPGVPTMITGHTTGYVSNYDSYDGCEYSGVSSPDRVFALVPTLSGTMTVSLPNLGEAGGGFDGALVAWEGVCPPASLNPDPVNPDAPPILGCSDDWLSAQTTETLTFPVTLGTTYYVVVDGYSWYSYGNFQLTAQLQ